MEMEVINKEDEQHKEKVADVKQPLKDKTEEEAEVSHYSTLMRPQEDVYAEAFQTDKSAVKETEVKPEGNIKVYRMVCAILSIICLILLLVVIFLCTKPERSPVCPEHDSTSVSPTCSKETCLTLYNLPSRSPQCAEDWPSFGGSCYFLSTFRMNWSQSQNYCISKGGSLAVIKSLEVQNLLSKQGNLMYWIGLSQINGTWTWVDNTVLQKRYWAEEAPRGDCVYLDTRGRTEKNWARENCLQHSYFICQIPI